MIHKTHSLLSWFIKNDPRYGMSIRNLTPEEQGQAICEHYGFSFEEVYEVYMTQGKEEGDAELLARLNALDLDGE